MSEEEFTKKLSKEALESLNLWLNSKERELYKEEINTLISENNFAELEDRFYKHIEVGTGGIRGQLGAGSNRINLRIIGEAAQGLSQFIEDFGQVAKEKGVVVGHEARKMSIEFAELCCRVFAANGIKTYLFDSLRSTPEISFAVRHLGTIAGVQLTASHNPRTDNGFKFYWSDGGQVVPPADLKFMELVKKVTEIKTMNFESACTQGLVTMIGTEVDKAYIDAIKQLTLVKNRSAKIVFSPIHGAGSTNVLPVLKESGFDVTVVPEQEKPDENFPRRALQHGRIVGGLRKRRQNRRIGPGFAAKSTYEYFGLVCHGRSRLPVSRGQSPWGEFVAQLHLCGTDHRAGDRILVQVSPARKRRRSAVFAL